MATKQERARNQWPAHIELPTNDWLFTQEQIDSSPSLRDDPERRKLGKLLHFIASIAMPSEVHFLAQVYLRRYFQRCFFMSDKRDWYTATTCIFLAARTLEMHIGLDKLVKRAVERLNGTANQSKLNKEFYDWKDGMLKAEMVVMEKLCCDFILFEPFAEYTLDYSVPRPENPYEVDLTDTEVNNFWHWMSPQPDRGALSFFSHKLKSWGGQDIFLLYTLEEVSIAILIYTAGKFSIVFPRDYFTVRGIVLPSQKFKALIDLFYKIQSSSHPEVGSIHNALRNCPVLLDDSYTFERPESDFNNRSGAVSASEGNGLQSIHEHSTQEQDFTSTANASSLTPDQEREKTDYEQGVYASRPSNPRPSIDQQRDIHTPTTQQQPVTNTHSNASNASASATTHSSPHQQTTDVRKSNHFSVPSASTTPAHISMLKTKTAAPLIPMTSKKVIKKEATPIPPVIKKPDLVKAEESTDVQAPSTPTITTTATVSATAAETVTTTTPTTTSTVMDYTKVKRSKKTTASPRSSEDVQLPKKAPRLSARSTPQSSAALAAAVATSPETAGRVSRKATVKDKQETMTHKSLAPANIAIPKSADDLQKVTRKRQPTSKAQASAQTRGLIMHPKKTQALSSPVSKPKTIAKKKRSASDPVTKPLSDIQLQRVEELFALVEDGDLSDLESVEKPPGF